MNTKPALLILAAGMGSRYGSLKQIDEIGPSGERIIDYSVYDAIKAGFGKIVYVIRKSFEDEFNEVILNYQKDLIETSYVFQEIDNVSLPVDTNPDRTKPWGTGQAVLTAENAISTPFAVINADDFYGADSFRKAFNFLKNTTDNASTEYGLVGYRLVNTLSDFGFVSRGICEVDNDNFIKSITERTKISKSGEDIVYLDENEQTYALNAGAIASMNMFLFTPSIFSYGRESFERFLKVHGSDPKKEFFLPSLVSELIESSKATVKVTKTTSSWFGLTYKEDKPLVINKIKELVKSEIYPESLWNTKKIFK